MNAIASRWAKANIVVKVVVAVVAALFAIVAVLSLWELAAENIGAMSDLALSEWTRQHLTFQGWFGRGGSNHVQGALLGQGDVNKCEEYGEGCGVDYGNICSIM